MTLSLSNIVHSLENTSKDSNWNFGKQKNIHEIVVEFLGIFAPKYR
jgi:hypothetical protein